MSWRAAHQQLQTVDRLSVRGSPALPLASFDDVQTFQRELSAEPAPDCRDADCLP
ncbi:MAG TPA: hypothetical protein VFS67_21430 [Polyangiaceae bacterium]|jgi:hypothetical protein|nr:hypothetical protein [Polyangiaceae bacterium]